MRASIAPSKCSRVQPVEDRLQVVDAPARDEPVGARHGDAGAVAPDEGVDAAAGVAPARRRAPRRAGEGGERAHDLAGRVEEHVVDAVVHLGAAPPEGHHRRAVVVDGEAHGLGEEAGERVGEPPRGRDARLARGAARVEELELVDGELAVRLRGAHAEPILRGELSAHQGPPLRPSRIPPAGRPAGRAPAPRQPSSPASSRSIRAGSTRRSSTVSWL